VNQASVVFGTDTGVGKTVATAVLAAAAIARGHDVRVLKPVQTGAEADDDAAEINRLVGARIAHTGWRLSAPLAPAVAARLEDRRLDPGQIREWIEAQALRCDVLYVETAGGVAVEIVEGYDMARLGADLGYPAVIVCRPGLGTLNHTVLTVEHLRAAGMELTGLVVCGEFNPDDISHTTNPAELQRLTSLPIIARVPWLDLAPDGLAGRLAGVAVEVVEVGTDVSRPRQ
jgi:dethiobiotin synthetase